MGRKMFWLSVQIDIFSSAGMMAPSRNVDVATIAAGTDSVHIKGNGQSKDRFYDLKWVCHFHDKVRKLDAELQGEICSDFAMTVMFTEVFQGLLRVYATSTICTDKGHVFIIDNVGSAFEKTVFDDRVLVR
jgi:hypothetical protein